jgi:hypothetical protein
MTVPWIGRNGSCDWQRRRVRECCDAQSVSETGQKAALPHRLRDGKSAPSSGHRGRETRRPSRPASRVLKSFLSTGAGSGDAFEKRPVTLNEQPWHFEIRKCACRKLMDNPI